MTIRRERRDRIEIVTIDREAEANCIDGPTARALGRAFDELAGEDAVHAVVLTAAGQRSFCAGLDLKAFRETGPGLVAEVVLPETGWAGLAKRHFPKPLIAAVNGAAIGGGLELALACDLIVAAEHAEFAANEVSLGGLADGGACLRLPRWVPLAIAREMLLTGDPVGAARAYQVGLVNRVAPAAALLDTALALAGRVAAHPPAAMRTVKALLRDVLGRPEDEAWPINDSYQSWSHTTDEFAEGASAFAEKRRARFET